MGKSTIRIGHIAVTDHLILGLTKYKIEHGQETFNNIELDTQCMLGWDYVGDALAQGDIDAAFILAPYAMEIFNTGKKMKLVLLGHKTGSVFIKNKKANINKLEDFKGKTILIPFHLSVHLMLLHRMFKEKGMEIGPGKDVNFEVMAPSQIPEAMGWDENGELGGFIVAEPWCSKVVNEGYGEEFMLSKDIWPDHPCCVFVVSDDYLQKNPEGIQELTTSFVKSGMVAEQKPLEAAKVGAQFLNQKVEVIEKVLTQPVGRVKYGELMPGIKELDIIQDYMVNHVGAMTRKIDLEKFIDFTFAKGAGAK